MRDACEGALGVGGVEHEDDAVGARVSRLGRAAAAAADPDPGFWRKQP
jgi:hypothetical protein